MAEPTDDVMGALEAELGLAPDNKRKRDDEDAPPAKRTCGGKDVPDCSICLEPIAVQGAVDGCKHTFCKGCIDTWLAKSTTCPTCRVAIATVKTVDLTGAAPLDVGEPRVVPPVVPPGTVRINFRDVLLAVLANTRLPAPRAADGRPLRVHSVHVQTRNPETNEYQNVQVIDLTRDDADPVIVAALVAAAEAGEAAQ